MRYLFDHWPEVGERVRGAGAVAVFLDFDGTLAPLRPTPGEARLNQSMRRAIARLARNPRVHVSVISGRKVDDVRLRIRLPRVHYMGLHGWENSRPRVLTPEIQLLLELAKCQISALIADMPGIRIEDKGPVFAVHYRGASDQQVLGARASVFAVMTSLSGYLRVLEGSYSWEILPWAIGDKGSAALHQLDQLPPGALPVYIGDDPTDEPAFAALGRGLTIRVGRLVLTRAKFQLRDTGEVRNFLEKLESELS